MASDLALLHQYGDCGDPHAFAELVTRHASMVLAAATRVTRNQTIAEDVSQDCFLQLARASKTITGSVGAWLHRASVNRSIELCRADRARIRREAEAQLQQPTGSESSREWIARIDEAIASLPDELRSLITDHYLCGKSQQELAEELRVNQSTVQRRLQKGLAQLREELADDDLLPASLPMFLLGLPSPSVPQGLRQSLIKIGLSGVRAALPRAGLCSAGLQKTVMIAIAAVSIATTGYISVKLARQAPVDAKAANAMTAGQLPTAVRLTAEKTLPGGVFKEMERKNDGDHPVFDIDVMQNGILHELRIAEDGKLIWNKP